MVQEPSRSSLTCFNSFASKILTKTVTDPKGLNTKDQFYSRPFFSVQKLERGFWQFEKTFRKFLSDQQSISYLTLLKKTLKMLFRC